jgi:hypothetical protein
MTQQVINVGSSPSDGTGDPLRTAGGKINANFTELYSLVGTGGGGGGGTAVTLDPDHNDASHTLSGGNLVVTKSSNTGSREYTFSAPTRDGPLGSFKATVNSVGPAGEMAIGVSNQTNITEGYVGGSSHNTGLYQAGFIGLNVNGGGPSTTIFTYTTGHQLAFVRSKATGEVWVKNLTTGSNWNNNPSAVPGSVGGLPGPVGPVMPFVEFNDGIGKQVTFDFGYSAGTGIQSWNDSVATFSITGDYVSPLDFGANNDGSPTPLSNDYATLADAQAAYDGAFYFVTSLSQTKAYAGIRAAAEACFGPPGAEHANSPWLNKELRLGPGFYHLGEETITIRNTVGAKITGAGRLATKIHSNKTIFDFDGLWYSIIHGFSCEIQAAHTRGAMIIDGNVPGHPYSTRGVQGITLSDMLFSGGGSGNAGSVAFEMTTVGGSSAQGSENVFLNCHFQDAAICYYQGGYNALSNTFIGGNFQNYGAGIYVWGGTFNLYNTGFQSLNTDAALSGDPAWSVDVKVGDPGAFEGVIVHGCRTESLRFLWHDFGVRLNIACVEQRLNYVGWYASSQYGPNGGQAKATFANGTGWVASGTGSGPWTSGATEPNWASVTSNGGTIVDNQITWTRHDFDWIHSGGNITVDYNTVNCAIGAIRLSNPQVSTKTQRITSSTPATTGNPFISKWDTGPLIVDCTSGNRYIWLDEYAMPGRYHEIHKLDTSANTVTIRSTHDIEGGSFSGGVFSLAFGGGASVTKRFVYMPPEGGGSGDAKWWSYK